MSCFVYVCGGRTHIQVHRAGVKHTEPPPGPGSGARQELCSGLFRKGRWVSAFSIPAGGGRAAYIPPSSIRQHLPWQLPKH